MHTISIIISSGIIVVVVVITVIVSLITIIRMNIIIATVAPFSAPAPQAGKREPAARQWQAALESLQTSKILTAVLVSLLLFSAMRCFSAC